MAAQFGSISILASRMCRADTFKPRFPLTLSVSPRPCASATERRLIPTQLHGGQRPDPDAAPVRRDDGRQCRQDLAPNPVVTVIDARRHVMQCAENAGILGPVLRQSGIPDLLHHTLFIPEGRFGPCHQVGPAGCEGGFRLCRQRVDLAAQLRVRVPKGGTERVRRFVGSEALHKGSLAGWKHEECLRVRTVAGNQRDAGPAAGDRV